MKVTPLDLRQTHLSSSLRGYDRDEVRTLLADAADDYEAALRELDRLRQDLTEAKTQLGEHRDREENLRNTLLTAQKVADQIRENAGKEAEVLLRDAETRSQALLKDAELRSTTQLGDAEAKSHALISSAQTRSMSVTAEADMRAAAEIRDAESKAEATLKDATSRAQAMLTDAESRARTLLTDAQLRADATFNEAQLRSDAMVKDAQARVDVLLQKTNARLDELEHAVAEMRLRKRDVEGTLEQSIASLTYALEFVRTQDSRDDKVRMLRPRHAEGGAEQATRPAQGGEAAMRG
jgi:cell division initiation protein